MSRSSILASVTLLLAAMVGVAVPSASASIPPPTMNIAATAANVRCDPANSEAETKADVNTIQQQASGLLGFQESCDTVFTWEQQALGSAWSYYRPYSATLGRNSRNTQFWLTQYWNLANEGYIALNPNGTDLTDLTYVRLLSLVNGDYVVRVNTHWSACGQCSDWSAEQQATINEIDTLSKRWPNASIIITGDFNNGSVDNVLGTSINGWALHYDNDLTPHDTEQVIHLGGASITKTGSNTVWCQTCYNTGPLYTDHAVPRETYTLS